MNSIIPASKIAELSQGKFVGSVADNFGETIDQKIFHAEIILDVEKMKAETKKYVKIPTIIDFPDQQTMNQEIQNNYRRIKNEISELVEN